MVSEQDAARAELKIRRLQNGWLLKGKDGWNAFQNMAGLLSAVEEALTQSAPEQDSQQRFFHPDYPWQRTPPK